MIFADKLAIGFFDISITGAALNTQHGIGINLIRAPDAAKVAGENAIKGSFAKAKDIGDISVLNILSYVAIKRKYVDQVIKALGQGKIKKRKFKVGLA